MRFYDYRRSLAGPPSTILAGLMRRAANAFPVTNFSARIPSDGSAWLEQIGAESP